MPVSQHESDMWGVVEDLTDLTLEETPPKPDWDMWERVADHLNIHANPPASRRFYQGNFSYKAYDKTALAQALPIVREAQRSKVTPPKEKILVLGQALATLLGVEDEPQ